MYSQIAPISPPATAPTGNLDAASYGLPSNCQTRVWPRERATLEDEQRLDAAAPSSNRGCKRSRMTSSWIFTAAAHAEPQRAVDYLHGLQPRQTEEMSGPPHRRPLPCPGARSCPCPALSTSTDIAISGASWLALRRAQATPRIEQPTLFQPFQLREDHRPPGERSAAERYCEPSLFTLPERPA